VTLAEKEFREQLQGGGGYGQGKERGEDRGRGKIFQGSKVQVMSGKVRLIRSRRKKEKPVPGTANG